MSTETPVPATPETPAPLTASVLETVMAKGDLDLKAFREHKSELSKATEPPAPVVATPPAPVVAQTEPGATTTDAPEADADDDRAEATEAGRVLAKQTLRAQLRDVKVKLANKNQHIEVLTARLAKVDELEQKLAALEGKASPPETARPAPSTATTADAEPKEEDFEHYRDYVKAQARWESKQEIKQALDAERAERAQLDSTRSQQSALDRVQATGLKAHPDFDEALTASLDAGVRWSPAVTSVVLTHPLGAELAYLLATDHALATSLSAIRHPVSFGLALAPVLSRLSPVVSGPGEQPPRVSKAQAPPKPVGAAPTAQLPSLATVDAGTDINLELRRRLKKEALGR